MLGFPAAASARSSAVAPCSGSMLGGSFAVEAGSAGAGNIVYTLRLQERGTGACFVSGIPGLTLLGAHGRSLPTHRLFVGPGGSLTAVVVVVGGGTRAATLTARFSPDVPGPGEPQTRACEPTATRLRVAFSGGSLVVPVSPPTPVCEHGTLQLTAFRAA